MRDLILRIWSAPLPRQVRRAAEIIANIPWLQRLIVPSFLVGVVGIIENDRGELLLLRHTYRSAYPWGLPTGFLEHGEQPIDALKREIQEETGLLVDILPAVMVRVDTNRPLVNVIFRGHHRGGTFEPSLEVSEAAFYSTTELPPMLPSQRQLLDAVIREEISH